MLACRYATADPQAREMMVDYDAPSGSRGFAVTYNTSSRARLNAFDIPRFPSESLFDRVGRTLCRAACLPRKELFESWEVARRVRRRFRGGRVVDLAAGHGLLAYLMVLLDDTSESAFAVDTKVPKSAARVAEVLCQTWPRLDGRVTFLQQSLETFSLTSDDVVVCAHGCGTITDRVLERACDAHARVAVLPCCHAIGQADLGGLTGWAEPTLAMDLMRAERVRARGYMIYTAEIPTEITVKNRLLLATPAPREQNPR